MSMDLKRSRSDFPQSSRDSRHTQYLPQARSQGPILDEDFRPASIYMVDA
jgi:hypothetical protein